MRKGFTLLELLIVVVILGVLALIATPTLLNAAEKSKQSAVKANAAAAVSSITSQFAMNTTDSASTIAGALITKLNAGSKNPYDGTSAAFADAAAIGTVTLVGTDATSTAPGFITVTGYGKTATTVLVTKVVEAPADTP